jgi:retron-type reverse transcriptase
MEPSWSSAYQTVHRKKRWTMLLLTPVESLAIGFWQSLILGPQSTGQAGSQYCCSYYQVHYCCDWLNGSCYHCCSKNRRATPGLNAIFPLAIKVMKQFDNLFIKICEWDNLLLAFKKAEAGKRSSPNVIEFRFRLAENLLMLKAELENGTYTPGIYTTFYVYEPKKRMISAAPFRDRVLHHALCNVIEPLFERSLIFDTFANRNGKGTHAAIRRCQEMMRKHTWVLKCDIKKYFPSIDHVILKELVAEKISCVKTLNLIFKIIDHSNPQEAVHDFFPGDNLFTYHERRKGLPMGNLTSQFLANYFLSPFDHFVKETLKAKGYVRYVDDFVIFSNDKEQLKQAQLLVSRFLAKYRLVLHPLKCHIYPTKAGISFLGQRLFLTHRTLRSENVRRMWVRLNIRLIDYSQGKLQPEKLECQLNSWLGHARQANTFHLRNKVFRYLWYEKDLMFCEAPVGHGWRLLEVEIQ